jgi:hypothetical protein
VSTAGYRPARGFSTRVLERGRGGPPHRTPSLRRIWTCSDFTRHEHRFMLSAWICGRVQRALHRLADYLERLLR